MKIIKSFLTNNLCYAINRKINVKGLMLHSVGCPQPKASVFINAWNNPTHKNSCVHAFIDGNDGNVYQTLPWEHRGWHAGGNANNTHIGVEMCEPPCITYSSGSAFSCSDLNLARTVVKRTYDAAVELFAMLCKTYSLNPLADGVIISHKEGHKRGIASNHGDPEHLWSQLGLPYTMATFREAVHTKMGVNVINTTQQNQEKSIWDYLLACIGNEYGVAGLMGNLYSESGLNPKNLQNSFNKKLNISDEDYTMLVDGDNYPDFIKDGAGYGLAQWTYYSRKKNLLLFSKQKGKSIGDLGLQLEFLINELMTGYKSVFNKLQSSTSVAEATIAVLTEFEKPADQGMSVKKKRTEFAQYYYDKYALNAEYSYKVRVIIPDLNIRKGPGTNLDKTGKCTGVGAFTVTEIRKGEGSNSGWGKLKSGAGWISMDYCTHA